MCQIAVILFDAVGGQIMNLVLRGALPILCIEAMILESPQPLFTIIFSAFYDSPHISDSIH